MSVFKMFLEKIKNTPFLQDRRNRQKLIFGAALCGALIVFLCFTGEKAENRPENKKGTQKFFAVPKNTSEGDVVSFEGAASAAPREEVWVRRMEGKANAMQDQNKDLQTKIDLMTKKVDVLEKMLSSGQEDPMVDEKSDFSSPKEASQSDVMEKDPFDVVPDFPVEKHASSSFPSQPMGEMGGLISQGGAHRPGAGQDGSFKTIAVIKRKDIKDEAPLVEGTMPAGTRVSGQTISGLAISTATSAQSDPHPIIIRLNSDFIMPRGFSAPLKDAVVIGRCHGDISATRAFCVLETLSYVEASGEIVEEKLQGWVFGKDGRYGLQGERCDKADEVMMKALLAGLASGMSSFFQATTTNHVFPVSPFGQTNALNPSQMLNAAGASGIGKALDRMTDIYVDIMEKMSPILLVNPGINVDIVLQSKLDFAKSVFRKTRVRLAKNARLRFAKDHARDTQIIQVRKDLQ